MLITADQHRFDYMGCAGAGFVRTPNLDALAARGMLMTHCFTNAPLCVPARISLASGLLPSRVGAMDNSAHLDFAVTTFYRRLRDAGYRVGFVGKLHLSATDEHCGDGARQCLFEWGLTEPHETEGKMFAGKKPQPQGPYGQYLAGLGLYDTFHRDYSARAARGWVRGPDDSVLPVEAFHDVYIGRHARQWLQGVPADSSWFHHVSFVGPHDPFDPPEEFARRYRDAAMPPAIKDSPEGKSKLFQRRRQGLSDEQVARTRRQYCALIELIDEQVGSLLQTLDERGMLANTCVFYTSDHGEMLGDHGLYTKSVPYEAAIHVPLIAAGPGIANGRSDAMVELSDLNPTMCQLAGLPRQSGIDARPFAGMMRGGVGKHRDEVLSELREFALLRDRRHKLVIHREGLTELYDLREDPDELRNLAGERGDVVAEMRKRLEDRRGRRITQ